MALIISDRASDFIVVEEDSGETYYVRHYQHFEWPEGASGPTIAIGYDCGYVTQQEAQADWKDIIGPEMLAAILPACGLRGGVAAEFVRTHGGSVTITWDQAMQEFREREVPKWLIRLSNVVPNCDMLSPDSLGALLSLTYNRGAGGYINPGPRFAEMREIRQMMADKNFGGIAQEILNMRRLWAVGGDLWKRRAHEATLFQSGLAAKNA